MPNKIGGLIGLSLTVIVALMGGNSPLIPIAGAMSIILILHGGGNGHRR